MVIVVWYIFSLRNSSLVTITTSKPISDIALVAAILTVGIAIGCESLFAVWTLIFVHRFSIYFVNSWRAANPNITQLWWDVDNAVKRAIKERTATETHGIRFIYKSAMLFIVLPSGRRLAYVKPRMGENKFGGESVTYEGVGTNKKWERIESYGPKFVENIVQAISRDILCYGLRTLKDYSIVGHVHDEIIIECPQDTNLDAICDQMGNVPEWITGLLLRADGYETQFYKKD